MRSSLYAPLIDEPRDYVGRPGVSPALAALVSARVILPEHHILDVGCGRGTDLLTLAQLGFDHLEGLDHNAASIRAAKRREKTLRKKTPRGARLADVVWHHATLDELLEMPPRSFDWIVDTFLSNNLEDADEPEYIRRLARLLPRGGGLLMHVKYGVRAWTRARERGPQTPHFDAGPPLLTWWAEGRGRWGRHASGYVQVLRRNGRRL